MTMTKEWSSSDYLNHVLRNNLHNVWSGWCNPKSGNFNGVRVSAYTPLFPADGNVNFFTQKCGNGKCDGNMVIPQEDVNDRIIYRKVCNGIVNGSKCGRKRNVVYRWVNRLDRTKLWFAHPNIVKVYGERGRSFYATNVLYDKSITNPKKMYVHEELMKACSLYIDIDIKRGTICDSNNRLDLHKAISILRDELDTFAGDSYNLQTSGNGVYIILHHRLVFKNIRDTMAKYNAWIIHMDNILKNNNVTKVKFDPINMPSRVFKMMGSIHQKHDLVCIPLDYDCNVSKMNSDDFKLKNFSIDKYVDDDGKLMYYNRFNPHDIKSLYAYLDDCVEDEFSGPRALRYNYKEGVEVLTGEEVNEVVKDAELFIKNKMGWKLLDIDIPGNVYYREYDDEYEIQMYGVREEHKLMVRKKVREVLGVD